MPPAVALLDTIASTGKRQWGLWLTASAAAILLTALALFGVYPPGDTALARLVQDFRLPGVGLVSEFLYRIGLSPAFQLIALSLAGLMLWRGHRLMAFFMVLAAAARLLVFFPKELVERPRPSPLLIDVSEQAGGFAFPSGHVLGAVLLWGFLYFAADQLISSPRARRLVQWSSLAVIALMGLQRVYAGAHWPSDVLGAYLWGGVILFVLVKAFEFCRRCQVPVE